jgi:hypothetical protein
MKAAAASATARTPATEPRMLFPAFGGTEALVAEIVPLLGAALVVEGMGAGVVNGVVAAEVEAEEETEVEAEVDDDSEAVDVGCAEVLSTLVEEATDPAAVVDSDAVLASVVVWAEETVARVEAALPTPAVLEKQGMYEGSVLRVSVPV